MNRIEVPRFAWIDQFRQGHLRQVSSRTVFASTDLFRSFLWRDHDFLIIKEARYLNRADLRG